MTAIYQLVDPRTNETRYIGKTGNTLNRRLWEHIHNARGGNQHRDYWIAELARFDLKPRIELIEEIDIEDADDTERYWIRFCRLVGCRLTNKTDGGDGQREGWTPPDGYTERQRTAQLKRFEDPAAREKLSTAQHRRYEDPDERARTGEAARRHWATLTAEQRSERACKGHTPESDARRSESIRATLALKRARRSREESVILRRPLT